ncbi:hypothetical protein FOZ63_032447 [Perkinsus olseni]|nr:hypothetical protein FOZ63_032447 [Perkinsus olseni]
MPDVISTANGHELSFAKEESGRTISLGVFLAQEIDRFNLLVGVVKASLAALAKAIKGLIVMSSDLEEMFNSFLIQRVPAKWTAVAYPCLKPLNSWVSDFIQRVDFMNSWAHDGPPTSFWLPAFFFPQGFMTAGMQMHARAHKIPIDSLMFETNVLTYPTPDDLPEPPETGVNIHGLFLQGAGWDLDGACLQESAPAVLFIPLPVISLRPVLCADVEDSGSKYSCPLYKTSVRAGTLSTTGHSTNFIMYLSVNRSSEAAAHWVRRGVASLCMLDD